MRTRVYVVTIVASICLFTSASLNGEDAENDKVKVRSLIQRLGSKDPADVGIHHELAMAGSRAVPSLINALSSQDSWTRRRAATSLGLIGDRSAVPALVKMAQRKEDRYKSALDALGQIGGPDAAGHLLAALPTEPLQNQPDIIRDLGLIGDNRAVPSLCAILRDSTSTKVRRRAAEALGRFRDPRSRAALRKALDNDPNWDVYRSAKTALMQQAVGHEPALSYAPLIDTIVSKQPEPPEGAEKWLRKYHESHPPSPLAPCRRGPTIHSFVLPARYKAAREQLLRMAEHPKNAASIVEALLEHMRHRQLEEGPGARAMRMTIDIGKSAVPALGNAARRGDETLQANAGRCLRAIEAQAPSKDAAQKDK